MAIPSPITRKIKGNDRILKQSSYLSQKTAYNYDDNRLEFGSDAKYFRLHQFSGVIRPKKGKRLKFGKGSNIVYAKQSKIPAHP